MERVDNCDCSVFRPGIITCGCGCKSNEIVYSHTKTRFYIGPKTNELVIRIDRVAAQSLVDGVVVTLEIKRHSCCPEDSTTLTAYSVSSAGEAHFDLSQTDFITDAETFPKGFYIGTVLIGDCEIDKVEIVKAPSFNVSSGKAVADRCSTAGTGYVEPACKTEDEVCDECECECRKPCESRIVVTTVDTRNCFEDIDSGDDNE